MSELLFDFFQLGDGRLNLESFVSKGYKLAPRHDAISFLDLQQLIKTSRLNSEIHYAAHEVFDDSLYHGKGDIFSAYEFNLNHSSRASVFFSNDFSLGFGRSYAMESSVKVFSPGSYAFVDDDEIVYCKKIFFLDSTAEKGELNKMWNSFLEAL